MTPDLLTGPLAQAIGLTLLHTLWQGAIVAAIAAAALALLRNSSAAVRYTVACGALALLVVMAVGTAWQLYEPRTIEAAAPVAIAPTVLATPEFWLALPAAGAPLPGLVPGIGPMSATAPIAAPAWTVFWFNAFRTPVVMLFVDTVKSPAGDTVPR